MPVRTRDFLLIPNILSTLRCLAAVPAFFLFNRNPAPFLPIFILSVFIILTDFLDGYLARRLDQTSDLGLLLDPLGDKLIMLATFTAMLASGHIRLPLFLTILSKDILIALAGALIVKRSGQTPASNTHGKWASAALAFGVLFRVALGGSTLFPAGITPLKRVFLLIGEVGLMLGVAFALLSLVSYGCTGYSLLRGREPSRRAKGLFYLAAAVAIGVFFFLFSLPQFRLIAGTP